MSRGKLRSFMYWLGSGLSLLAIVFIVKKLREYGLEISVSALQSLSVPLATLAVLYGLTGTLLALAWRDLLRYFGLNLDSRTAICIYGMSQLSKYVPGNVFHFVGRQALGLEAGLPMWPLAKSAVWEIGMLVCSGSLFLLLALPHRYLNAPVAAAFIAFILTLYLVVWLSNRWFGRWIARVVCWHATMLALSGLIFLALLLLVLPGDGLSTSTGLLVCGAYVTAWLAGLIVPGAPAGMGIREVVLFALLHGSVKESDLITTIVLSRLVTLGGDVAFFLLALSLKTRASKTV